ncbi:hypothetical protein D3C71_1521110 [compost metagenome]
MSKVLVKPIQLVGRRTAIALIARPDQAKVVQGGARVSHGIAQAQIQNAFRMPDRGSELGHVHVDRVRAGAGALPPLAPVHQLSGGQLL